MTCLNGHFIEPGDRFCGTCGVPLVALSLDELHAHVQALAEAAHAHVHACPNCGRDTRLAGHVVTRVAGVPIVQCPDYTRAEPMVIAPEAFSIGQRPHATGERLRFTYVVAMNHQHYDDWLRSHPDVDRSRHRYVTRPDSLRGLSLRPSELIFLPGWQDRRPHGEVAQFRDVAQFVVREPEPEEVAP